VFGSHEKITKCKNLSLANIDGIRSRPVVVAGFRGESLTRSGRIQPDQWPDPVISSRIQAILARSGRLGQNLVHRQPASVAGFRGWQFFGDWMLSGSSADWIPTTENY
jgi:hypothetical protein